MTEAPENRYQDAIAGLDHRYQHGLDGRACRAIDEEGPLVAGLEHLPVQGHDFVHVAGELRIELSEERHRHGAQNQRINIDRSRSHEQAW